jgi:hypothetical protein
MLTSQEVEVRLTMFPVFLLFLTVQHQDNHANDDQDNDHRGNDHPHFLGRADEQLKTPLSFRVAICKDN